MNQRYLIGFGLLFFVAVMGKVFAEDVPNAYSNSPVFTSDASSSDVSTAGNQVVPLTQEEQAKALEELQKILSSSSGQDSATDHMVHSPAEETSSPPTDDSWFMRNTTAPYLVGGVAGKSPDWTKPLGAIGLNSIIDGARSITYIDLNLSAGSPGVAIEGDVRARYRVPFNALFEIDPEHRFWMGFGVDVGARSPGSVIPWYARIGGIGYVGVLLHSGDKCLFELIGKIGLDVASYETTLADTSLADHILRPTTGAEMMVDCHLGAAGNLRFVGNWRYTGRWEWPLGLGADRATNRVDLHLSDVWPVADTGAAAGVFIKSQVRSDAPGNPNDFWNHYATLLGGLEIRWGR